MPQSGALGLICKRLNAVDGVQPGPGDEGPGGYTVNRAQVTIDGNEAAAYVAHHLSEVIAIYPITPSSAMGEWSDQWETFAQRAIAGDWEQNGAETLARTRKGLNPETPVTSVKTEIKRT